MSAAMSTYSSTELIPAEPKRSVRQYTNMNWNEVRAQVQQPNGSVRTSPRLAAIPAQQPVLGQQQALGKPAKSSASSSNLFSFNAAPRCSSRGGSSRGGSSGKSSRSSSLNGRAREGDVETCSRPSTGGWETSTNSSETSRPRTPPECKDWAPSPTGSKAQALLHPDPIRTTFIIPPQFPYEEHIDGNLKADGLVEAPSSVSTTTTCDPAMDSIADGTPIFKWDPYGRDQRRCDNRAPQQLMKLLEGVRMKIDSNLQQGLVPTSEKLDGFVREIMHQIQWKLKNSPHRKALQVLVSRHFSRFWSLRRNEKVRSITPEELIGAVTGLIESLNSERWQTEQQPR